VVGENTLIAFEAAGKARTIVADHVRIAHRFPERAFVVWRIECAQHQAFDERRPRFVEKVRRESGRVERPGVPGLMGERLRCPRAKAASGGSRDRGVVHANGESAGAERSVLRRGEIARRELRLAESWRE